MVLKAGDSGDCWTALLREINAHQTMSLSCDRAWESPDAIRSHIDASESKPGSFAIIVASVDASGPMYEIDGKLDGW